MKKGNKMVNLKRPMKMSMKVTKTSISKKTSCSKNNWSAKTTLAELTTLFACI